MRFVVGVILILVLCVPVRGENSDGKTALKKGREELVAGKYDDAILSLSTAEKGFPLLGDYALLWLSEAYLRLGDHVRALASVRSLLKRYPQSPLAQKARGREIEAALEIPEESPRTLYESYAKDYPSDREMKLRFARWLNKNGQREKAKVLFKEVYIAAGGLSGEALRELEPSDIAVEDMLRHASNLIASMNYATAESVLRSALERDDGRMRTAIMRELGLSLFKQKKYRDAASVYLQAGDRYWHVRSLYRAGESATLEASIDHLLADGDSRIASVLIAMASDRRRDGKIDNALSLYQAVMERYPSETEECRWGIGWTYYLAGEYRKAAEIFSALYKAFGDPKYLYWKIRSVESLGDDASADYAQTSSGAVNFYRILLDIRSVDRSLQAGNAPRDGRSVPVNVVRATPASSGAIERVEHLVDLGFRAEAITEMVQLSKNAGSLDELALLCAKFEELGAYKYSIRLAATAPQSAQVSHFLYPYAFKDLVDAAAAERDVDPLLVLAIAREESRFDEDARSPAGAIGLMQLMPPTAMRLDRALNIGIYRSHDLTDAKKNLHIGAHYLRALLREFGSYPQAIAAYNAGEERVRKWLEKGKYRSADEFIEDIPFMETRQYVKRVLASLYEYKKRYANDPLSIRAHRGFFWYVRYDGFQEISL